MRKVLTLAFLLMVSLTSFGQISFSKFKLYKDEPFGNFPGRKGIELKFKNESDKNFKYVAVDYYVLNGVGDVISGLERGIREDGKEYIKPKVISCTGPFEVGKSYGRSAGAIIQNRGKDLVAFPYAIEITYMGQNKANVIYITKENLKQYFPKMEWIDYNRYNDQL